MANTTPQTGNTPTGDAAAASIAADSATGTATDKSVAKTAGEKKAAEAEAEPQREAGSLWTAAPTAVEGGEEQDKDAKERAREEEQARIENPNEVVYRAADTEL